MNTYHLNPELRKISSMISVKIHGRQEKRIAFPDGQRLVDYEFDRPYIVNKIYEQAGYIVIELIEQSSTPTSLGDDSSFF